MGARMIPRAPRATAGNLRRPWSAICLLCLAACVASGEPALARLARERRDGAAHAERERHHRQLVIAEQETRDLLAAITAAKAQSVEAAAALRAARAELALQLEQLQIVERDLEAARARLQQVEAEQATAPR